MSEPKNKEALIEKLWARMSERGDFPMLSNSLRTTISAMKSDDYDFTALVQVVLSDFTLTQKVLRLANSAMYMAFGGNITTVSRALMVLGMEAVGHLVLGLKLVDHFQQSQSAGQQIDAKLELNRAMLAGCIARKVTEAGDVRSGEQAVVCTLMRQLGKLLCLFYLETEWQQVRERADSEGRSDDEMCMEILGVSFEELGQEAATRWGLPTVIRSGMKPYDPLDDDETMSAEVRWLRAVTSFSTEVSALMTVAGDDPQVCEAHVQQAAELYSEVLNLESDALLGITNSLAQENVSKHYMKEIDGLRAQAAEVKIQDAERHIRDGLGDLRSLPSENLLAQVLTMASETAPSRRAWVLAHGSTPCCRCCVLTRLSRPTYSIWRLPIRWGSLSKTRATRSSARTFQPGSGARCPMRRPLCCCRSRRRPAPWRCCMAIGTTPPWYARSCRRK
jgi:HD-like signal output (HDOD) protein